MEIKNLGRDAKYKTLAESLRRSIAAGEFPVGSRLPSENELVTMFNVSRPVVREAIGALAQEGLVERIHGSGTFVAEPPAAAASTTGKMVNLYIDDGLNYLSDPDCGFYSDLMFQLNVQLSRNRFLPRIHFVPAAGPLAFDPIDGPSIFCGLHLFRRRAEIVAYAGKLPGQVIFVDFDLTEVPRAISIVSPNQSGGKRATEYLIGRGHQKIGFVGSGNTNYDLRLKGYRAALAEHQLEYDENIVWKSAETAMSVLLENPKCVDALFCCADNVAVQLANLFRRRGIELSRKLELVTYDYTNMLKPAGLDIPGIHTDREEMAAKVIEVLEGRETRRYIEVTATLQGG